MGFNISHKINNLRLAKKLLTLVSFIVLFDLLAFPFSVMAAQEADSLNDCDLAVGNHDVSAGINISDIPYLAFKEEKQDINTNMLPKNNDLKTKAAGLRVITAYNSEAAQTDNSPCITANGFNLCAHGVEDSIAANFLPFGAKVMIPNLFGDRIFVVRDRMNARYPDRLDVWFKEKSDAVKFGVKLAKIEVVQK
jgi:3D (Asp-Asp-Asp) domain-containing protein